MRTTEWWIPPEQHPAIVRQIRRAALLDIATHEPTNDEIYRETTRLVSVPELRGAFCALHELSRQGKFDGDSGLAAFSFAYRRLTRRQRAALRLLRFDERLATPEERVAWDAAEEAERTPDDAPAFVCLERRVEVGP